MLGDQRKMGAAGVEPYLPLDCPFSDVRFAPPISVIDLVTAAAQKPTLARQAADFDYSRYRTASTKSSKAGVG